jgi:hypothetical protein
MRRLQCRFCMRIYPRLQGHHNCSPNGLSAVLPVMKFPVCVLLDAAKQKLEKA